MKRFSDWCEISKPTRCARDHLTAWRYLCSKSCIVINPRITHTHNEQRQELRYALNQKTWSAVNGAPKLSHSACNLISCPIFLTLNRPRWWQPTYNNYYCIMANGNFIWMHRLRSNERKILSGCTWIHNIHFAAQLWIMLCFQSQLFQSGVKKIKARGHCFNTHAASAS